MNTNEAGLHQHYTDVTQLRDDAVIVNDPDRSC